MTAAYELSRPEHGDRYAVTVYQMGFRLGGKGASGRGDADRIEEHGLHLWMGFYENAFRLMREAYGELGRDWRQAFEPAPEVAVVDRVANGQWSPWIAHFPPGRGLPGDPLVEHSPFSVRGYLVQAAGLVLELLRSAHERGAPAATRGWPESPRWPTDPAGMVDAVGRLLRLGRLATAAAVYEAADLLRAAMAMIWPPALRSQGFLLPLLDAIAAATRRNLAMVVEGDVELRRIWQVIDLILAILRGATMTGLAVDPRGFDALNDHDWIEWLRLHGAAEESLRCGFVRGIYDLVFAYEDGDLERPRLAAGVALRGSMRMFFTYRGALFWRMTAGMGDVVFSPLYQVCKRRGVRFEFFHRLRDVGVAAGQDEGALPHVDRLVFDRQAEVRGGGEYDPIVDVHGWPCWPSKPDYDQLVDGEALARDGVGFETPWEQRVAGERVLEVGRDFDLVVLGIGVAAIPHTCPQLLDHSPRWRKMSETTATAATQALQLWMSEDMAQLGWRHGQVNLSGFVEPFDTWADMRHLIPRENFAQPVRSLAYFVSVLADVEPDGDRDDPRAREALYREQYARVRQNAIEFLERDVGALWPNAVAADSGFRWELLVAGSEAGGRAQGEARIDTQFWMANVNPSDRYSLSVPGSIVHRISPLDLDFDNLTVAGDWTRTGLDSGCVESAVMSGMLAAHALSHSPPLATITGYDHP